jgi:hypothetical protein
MHCVAHHYGPLDAVLDHTTTAEHRTAASAASRFDLDALNRVEEMGCVLLNIIIARIQVLEPP